MMAKLRIIILLLMVTSGVVIAINSDYSKSDETADQQALSGIPTRLDGWRGVDDPLEELVYDILETRSIINRNYFRAGSQRLHLSIVYYTATKVDFHAPESCLGGQGFSVEKSFRQIPIQYKGTSHPVNVVQLIRHSGSSTQLVYYFYKAGDFLGESYIKLRWNLVLNKFSSGDRSGSLIRFSIPVVQEDYDTASTTLVKFIEAMYPAIITSL